MWNCSCSYWNAHQVHTRESHERPKSREWFIKQCARVTSLGAILYFCQWDYCRVVPEQLFMNHKETIIVRGIIEHSMICKVNCLQRKKGGGQSTLPSWYMHMMSRLTLLLGFHLIVCSLGYGHVSQWMLCWEETARLAVSAPRKAQTATWQGKRQFRVNKLKQKVIINNQN